MITSPYTFQTEFTPKVLLSFLFLPPAYVVRGKVIFILGNVCLFTITGGGYPISGLVAGGGGYPIPGLATGGGGVPHPRSGQGGGVPHPRSGQGEGVSWVPPLGPEMGYPPARPGLGYPLDLDGVPPPNLGWHTPPGPGTGYPPHPPPDLAPGTPPPRTWDWVTPPLRALDTRRAVCLLRSRRKTFLLFEVISVLT